MDQAVPAAAVQKYLPALSGSTFVTCYLQKQLISPGQVILVFGDRLCCLSSDGAEPCPSVGLSVSLMCLGGLSNPRDPPELPGPHYGGAERLFNIRR